MREIIIISGKGGTGKTSLTGAFAHLAAKKVICDLDVDAPDLHLLLQPVRERQEEFYSGHEARIDPKKCDGCGICASMCQFGAIRANGAGFIVNPLRCEGCKVCVAFCPAEAIGFPEKHCGQWYVSSTRFGPLVAIGVTANLFLYVFINAAMVMGLIPVVGVPLPLISYGGTAMMTLGIGMGLLMSIARQRKLVQT